MDVFGLREALVGDYASYIRSFIRIEDERIAERVEDELRSGLLWPDPLIQLNPSFEPAERVDDLVNEGVLHPTCADIFRLDQDTGGRRSLRLYRHQADAIRVAQAGRNYVLTTGTGSGKSLSYIVPIVDHVLRAGSGQGIKAIVVYPMNALANSQYGELEKFLGDPTTGNAPATFARYTGQENDAQKKAIVANPPDILLTNYVMLELLMTRPQERNLIKAAEGLRFLVLDELHTYRGRQGADVALLVRRVRDRMGGAGLRCVGTSATMASGGSYAEQQAAVADVATRLFGSEVRTEDVIGETLRRATRAWSSDDGAFIDALTTRLNEGRKEAPPSYEDFIADPLSRWIESVFGVRWDEEASRLARVTPRSLLGNDGAAQELSVLTGVSVEQCAHELEAGLMAGYNAGRDPTSGFRPFAFRLHQFISRGDTVHASPEREGDRYVTVHKQQYVPGNRDKVLLPLAFCRECGQEYYTIRRTADPATGRVQYVPRDLRDQYNDELEGEAGFLYLSTSQPWPEDDAAIAMRLPDDWLEETAGGARLRKDRRKYLPSSVAVTADGLEDPIGQRAAFLTAPFRFCLRCGVAYGSRQRSDFAKLTTLGSEGRSTATTILSLSAVRRLRTEQTLKAEARKLLSFTDNRQDAALQAGHFNDFVEVGLLRGALYRAVEDAGARGIRHDELTQRVADAMRLPFDDYAADPTVRFAAKEDTEHAFRQVLGYRLYRDLRRGWRVTAPNLEQAGLLEIDYRSLDELCDADDIWSGLHPALAEANAATRCHVARALLDYMRRELAVKVDYLDARFQERMQQQSAQRLSGAWAMDEDEKLEVATTVLPRSRKKGDWRGHTFLSARGGFGLLLGRPTTFGHLNERPSLKDREEIIRQLFEALRTAGLVERVLEPDGDDEVPGYQVPAAALVWRAGSGERSFHDPIRVPALPEEGGQTNAFFVDFYRHVAQGLHGMEAREHTAQVPYAEREEREERFEDARLPILYCSPTMELGVDIGSLNVVNLRNVPPTPANYAQRSGRAGRSGQPALVFTYCTTGSSHDQYFFRRPERMVAGAVSPPRLDLANEDLVRSHVHAVWLAETRLSLGKSLLDVLDVEGETPSLELHERVRAQIEGDGPRERAGQRVRHILGAVQEALGDADWYSSSWVDDVLRQAPRQFDKACDRWRSLYRSALAQFTAQTAIVKDASRGLRDKNEAKRLRREAEQQLELLTQVDSVGQSDFYSYRYFASEGFLPGYNFPRLPLSAYIPARRKRQHDEFLSRPRFLAISEFGPRAIVYHEGSQYVINKVILPVAAETPGQDDGVLTHRAKRCEQCGYLHPLAGDVDAYDVCERCGEELSVALTQLFRLENVSTKRRERITSDEEERMRLGYEIVTGVRFGEQDGRPTARMGSVRADGHDIAEVAYGNAATLWRINTGWARRKDKHQMGFVLDTERGYWATNEQAAEDPGDAMSKRTQRVIPYVEDRRNALLVTPRRALEPDQMASLQAALKQALQVHYQLEDDELAAEPLPNAGDRRQLLIYEAAEGGAGVLRRLLDAPDDLALVAREALRLCHFDPDTGDDLGQAPGAEERCEAACYDCLMSYRNQRDHALLDRLAIRDVLLELAKARVEASPTVAPRAEHRDVLDRLADSGLERRWLEFLERHGLRLPSEAQPLLAEHGTRPDFVYRDHHALVYVDGPPHDYPDRQRRDEAMTSALEDAGYWVIRFHHEDDWRDIVGRYPSVFGSLS